MSDVGDICLTALIGATLLGLGWFAARCCSIAVSSAQLGSTAVVAGTTGYLTSASQALVSQQEEDIDLSGLFEFYRGDGVDAGGSLVGGADDW